MGTNQNISKLKIEQKNGNQIIDKNNYIESLPTFSKIGLAQNLLKEMYSLKERFEDNKNKMIDKIEQNCLKYYKNKIYSKEIYDYFETNNLEEHFDYNLTNDLKDIIQNILYEPIYNFLFTLRNNNNLVIQIINNCNPKYYKEIANFIIHFFYEDISNCTFFQEELFLIIYLYFEDLIFKKLPFKLNSSFIKKNSDLYNEQIKNNFIYFLFNSLTKKEYIRNYLSSFLSDLIFKLEEYRYNLSTEPFIINKIIENKEEKVDINKLNKVSLKIKKNKSKENIFDSKNSGNIFLKNNKKLKETIDTSNNNIKNAIETIKRLSIGNIKLKGRLSIDPSIDISKILEKLDKNDKLKDKNNNNKKDNYNLENRYKEEIKIDPFFDELDIAYTYICEKLNYYENIKDKNKKDYGMIEYLDILLNEITKDGEPVEIFSTILLKNELKLYKMNKNKENFEKIINKIKSNYDYIISFINILIIKIKDNIKSIPFFIKCIFKIIEELLNKKYKNSKKEVFNYLLLMTKTRIFLGYMIIPMLNNIDYSGVFTDGIISEITKNNLDIIVNILRIIISGSLFLVENKGFTIFNKYIIEIIPQIFDIILEIDKNCILPDFITKLINEIPENINDIHNINKKIIYNYFLEKKTEKIKFDSICFSWKDLYILVETIENNKNIFINNNKNEKQKKLFEDIINNNKRYLENYKENIKNKKIEYFLLTKIYYEKEFENKINKILKDNFDILFQGEENNEVSRFKKCLSEVLAYVNLLQIEDFSTLIKNNENENITKISDINNYLKNKKIYFYQNMNMNFNTKKSEENKKIIKKQNNEFPKKRNSKNGIDDKIGGFLLRRKSIVYKEFDDIKQDIDFKNVIFPFIIDKVMSEIYYNSEKGKSQRIIFCISYLQTHINDLPINYTENNFKKLFIDILKESEMLIKELQNNILNEFYTKIRNSKKLNLIASKDYYQIKNMERFSFTGYLFNKLILKGSLKINNINESIDNIQLELNVNDKNNNIDTIQSFINKIPNFREIKNIKNILEFEKQIKLNEIINTYFQEIKNVIKNEKIITRFSLDEFLSIVYELQNYILFKLYDKLYPINDSIEDIFFYKKCCRLDFIKPENIIKDKNMVNEKLLEISINYINEIDKKFTPIDKIKNFGKAIDILKNSMSFNSGKSDLGLDDTLPFIIYIVLKSKPKNINTNFNYCNLYINPELSKRQFGNILTQYEMVMNIIKKMKYNDLINVNKEQFGNDE